MKLIADLILYMGIGCIPVGIGGIVWLIVAYYQNIKEPWQYILTPGSMTGFIMYQWDKAKYPVFLILSSVFFFFFFCITATIIHGPVDRPEAKKRNVNVSIESPFMQVI
ncbi:hypothetical protein Pla110_14440 [Polystyrenella longa]|uniref:Uncharacterized protein n=1 Tax=Polystyrenella longa TaxID=2528007 RepID=A0A518CKH3_9PLAN|nr:hypothetical protein [Polystyrenella longa]QDU79730.1 hypothetical protein Pla110_14440 [Polystyrenella longa]